MFVMYRDRFKNFYQLQTEIAIRSQIAEGG